MPSLPPCDRVDREALDGGDRLCSDRAADALRGARQGGAGLSDRLLSQRLRELEEEGLVERQVEAGTPVRVTYSLTEAGQQLDPVLQRAEGLGEALEESRRSSRKRRVGP